MSNSVKLSEKQMWTLKLISESSVTPHYSWYHHITMYSLRLREMINVDNERRITLTEKGKSVLKSIEQEQ